MTADPTPSLPWRLWIGSAAVLATLTLGGHAASRVGCWCALPPEEAAYSRARQLADEAFVDWAQSHPDATCPASIDDLAPTDARDPWGRTYRVICTRTRLVVVSAGPDATFGTPDDISNLREPE